jgi:type II secretory pathway pseudopilin PulG
MKSHFCSISDKSSEPCGFSLIEVTLAIGIIAFALLAVLALLPVGLKTNRESTDQARATQIMNAIAVSIQNAVPSVSPSGTYTQYLPLPPYRVSKMTGLPTDPPAVTQNPKLGQVANGLPAWEVPGGANGGHMNTSYFPTRTVFYLNEQGIIIDPAANQSLLTNARYFAAVSINPPRDKFSVGVAYIALAWPGAMTWVGSNASSVTGGNSWQGVTWPPANGATGALKNPPWPPTYNGGLKVYQPLFSTKPAGQTTGLSTTAAIKPSYVETFIYFHSN